MSNHSLEGKGLGGESDDICLHILEGLYMLHMVGKTK